MITEIILFVLEIIGTIAFAVSGAFVAIKARFDIFGVIVIGCITAVGGGIMRDLLIGATPPAVFSKPYVLAIATGTAVLVFLLSYFRRAKFDTIRERIEHINRVFDSIGLAAFTVMGTELAFSKGVSDNLLLSVALGVLSGVGGGVLRDILTRTPAYIFTKHVYALVSIVGAVLYFVVRVFATNTVLPSALAMVFIVCMRILAARYHWGLPKISLDEKLRVNAEKTSKQTVKNVQRIDSVSVEDLEQAR